MTLSKFPINFDVLYEYFGLLDFTILMNFVRNGTHGRLKTPYLEQGVKGCGPTALSSIRLYLLVSEQDIQVNQ